MYGHVVKTLWLFYLLSEKRQAVVNVLYLLLLPGPGVPLPSNSFLHSVSLLGLRGGQDLSLVIFCGGVLSEPSLPPAWSPTLRPDCISPRVSSQLTFHCGVSNPIKAKKIYSPLPRPKSVANSI